MRKKIVFFLIAAVTVLLSVAVLIYFDPFSDLFDSFLGQKQSKPLSSVNYGTMWHKGKENPTSIPTEISEMTERYFECFIAASGDKEANAEGYLKKLYADSAADCVYDLAGMRSCNLRLKNSGIDLAVSDATVHMWAENAVAFGSGDGFILTLTQSTEYIFKSLKGILSGEGNHVHTFVFEKTGGVWYITSHECESGVWDYSKKAMNNFCGSEAPGYSLLSDSLEPFGERIESSLRVSSELIKTKGYGVFPKASKEYNREGAVEYAFRWCTVIGEQRNTDRWWDYENDSGNFASQCIYAGIGKMDTEGTYIWKWFGERVNYDIPEEGCSMSWTEPENFWLYCSSHEGTGLSAYTGVSGGQLEKGDIVQLIIGGEAAASVVVTDVVSDVSGNKLDFLVTGHDSDIVNFPLSLVHCDGIRMIKILGFN